MVAVLSFARLAGVGVAAAEEKPQVAIASFALEGEGLEAFRSGYEKDLIAGLSVGFTVMPAYEVDHARHTVPSAACQTKGCLIELGKALGVRYLVLASLERIGSTGYPVHLEIIDASDGHSIAKSDDPCSVCTTAESHSTLSDAAANLKNEFDRNRPTVTAPAPPPPPVTLPVVAGAERPHRPLRTAAVVSWAASVVLIGTGVGLLAADGKSEGFSTSSDYQIHVRRFEGTPGGATLVGVGGAVAVGGLVFWLIDQHRHMSTKVAWTSNR
jgi:hypothetical protein